MVSEPGAFTCPVCGSKYHRYQSSERAAVGEWRNITGTLWVSRVGVLHPLGSEKGPLQEDLMLHEQRLCVRTGGL